MRMRSTLLGLLVVLAIATVAACARTAPINNVNAAAVAANDTSVEDVRAAIIRAGSARGWRMREEGPNHLVGRLELRDHVAEVDIRYDARSYDITYRDSSNLEYDPESETIHSNYNSWVQNLDRDIQNQLLSGG